MTEEKMLSVSPTRESLYDREAFEMMYNRVVSRELSVDIMAIVAEVTVWRFQDWFDREYWEPGMDIDEWLQEHPSEEKMREILLDTIGHLDQYIDKFCVEMSEVTE